VKSTVPDLVVLARVEVRKLLSTPAAYVAAGVIALLTVASVVTAILLAGHSGQAALGTADNAAKALAVAAVSSTAMIVMGILSVGGEYRHRTILSAYLAEPRRGRVLAAKLAVNAVVGLVVGAVTFGLALAVALPMYAAHGVHTLPVDVAQLWWGAALAGATYGMLGVAVGALTRNTVAAVIGVIVWTQVIEVGILQAAVPSIAKWLPTGAAVAVTGSATPVPGLLAPGIAALVLVGWTAALGLTAARVSLRRELR
jgi:ABC-2 type transport system permease protein